MQSKSGQNQKVKLRLSKVALALLVVAEGTFAQQPPPSKVMVVEPKVTGGEADRATGFTIATPDGNCALLTAQHVNRRAMVQDLLLKDANYPKGFDATVSISIEEYDVLVTSKINGRYLGGCPPLPARATVEAALLGANFEVVSTSETGVISRLPVRVIEQSQTVLTLRPYYPDQIFISGMSGAPLMVDGRPIAFVQTTFGGVTAKALRLDALPGNVRDYFATQPVLAAGTIVAREPYDVSGLPREIQNIVAKARAVRRNAEAVAVAARSVRAEAEDAAREAKTIKDRMEVQRGYAWFDGDDTKDAKGRITTAGPKYAGQVISGKNGSLTAHGYGVSSSQDELSLGNEDYCKFSIDYKGRCQGIGVRTYGINKNNNSLWQLWEGNFVNGREQGLGILTFSSDSENSEIIWDRLFDSRDKLVSSFGIWTKRDGRRFEGTIGSNWEFGVLWKPDGSLRCFGYWRIADGTVDHKRNAEAKYPECK